MFKSLTLVIVAVTLLVLGGCDADSNSFSQRDEPSVQTHVALLSPNNTKEMK